MSETQHTAENDARCWRHDYEHREYVCTCEPPVEGDTGREGCTWGFNPATGEPVLLSTPDGRPLVTRRVIPPAKTTEAAQ